jgi:twinkle protein
VECDEAIGTHKRYYFPVTKKGKLVTYKFKDLTIPKKAKGHFGRLHSGIKDVDLFGSEAYHLTPETIVLTEGELDACAAYHMLRTRFKKVHCVSIPDGANPKDIARQKAFFDKARNVVICGDQDEPGREFVKKACRILPKVRVMEFSGEKDACDMLLKGKQIQFVDAFVNAKVYKPSSIVTSSDVKEEAMIKPEWGLSYPFEELTRLTYGFRDYRVIGIAAAPAAGKTCLIRALQEHLVFQHNIKIGIIGLEESPAEQQRELASFVMNKPLHQPDCEYNEKKLSKVIDSFDQKVFFFDHKGDQEWESIIDTMRYMEAYGIRCVFIDPLSALVMHLEPSEANTYLGRAMSEMKKLKDQTGLTIFHINHLNNPKHGPDHGAGGKVYASQITGSKAMWKFSTDIWGLERDQYAEDPEERNTSRLVTLKYRKPSKFGSFKLLYDEATGTLKEKDNINQDKYGDF